ENIPYPFRSAADLAVVTATESARARRTALGKSSEITLTPENIEHNESPLHPGRKVPHL
ncbi:hypothetical protein Dimus_037508, partial [Dionaea muscipula]